MSEIKTVLSTLAGTEMEKILTSMEEAYNHIASEQDKWYKSAKFYCWEGCGECCRNFEPDLLESEAVFMAAWILENQPEVAEKLMNGEFPLPRNKGCQFWDENNPYHCTIYGGRPSICRLFGACGNRSKNGEIVFKPCRFYPEEKLKLYNPALTHKQFSQEEVIKIMGSVPPVMSDLMEPVVSIKPDNMETELIRNILPQTIARLKWIIQMNKGSQGQ